MKKTRTYIAVALMAMLMASCGDNKSSFNPLDDAQYYPVQVEINGKWGMIDSKGKMLFEDEFDNSPSVPCQGLFAVRENDGYTLYKAQAKPAPVLENLKEVGYASDGLIVYSKEGDDVQVADLKGNLKFDIPNIKYTAPAFSDGMLLVVDNDNKAGFINTKGEMVVAPKYDEGAMIYNEGYAFAATSNSAGGISVVILDKKGQEVGKLKIGVIPSATFSHGVAPAAEKDDGGQRMGFVNTKGEFSKLPEKVKRIGYYDDKVLVFYDGSYWGIMSREGEVLVRPKYYSIEAMNQPDRFLANLGKKYVVIDKNGEEKERIEYERVSVVKGNGFQLSAKEGPMSLLLDAKGQPVDKGEFVRMSDNVTKCRYIFSHKSDK